MKTNKQIGELDPTANPIVVAILYPSSWYGSEKGFAAELADLAALDSRLKVMTGTYVWPVALRGIVSSGATAPNEISEPPIGPELTEIFSSMQVAMAIDLPTDIVARAPHLRWVQAVGAGTEHLGLHRLAEAGIKLTSNAGSNGVAIAEFVMGRILAWTKRFDEIDARQVRHSWDPVYGTQLDSLTLGLVGYGGINRQVATRAAAFGMKINVIRYRLTEEKEALISRVYGSAELQEFLGACDIIVCAVPDTSATRGMFGEEAFGAMRPGAFFVNVGRGSLVDERALRRALESGRVSAAALDVASREPLPPDDQLWDCPRVKISPHCSSIPQTTFPQLHRLMRDNVQRYLVDRPLRSVVQPGRGY